jgi:nitroreductase
MEDRGTATANPCGPNGRPAPTDAPVHPLIRCRWSPRAVSDRRVEPELLRTLFEAARWAPSSYNEQPWRFLVATADDAAGIERMRSYLSPGNAWARRAPVLVLSAYRTTFERDGRPNRVAMRDLGAAEQNLALQAFALGLVAHSMAGFDAERAKAELLPDGYEPGALTALGYPGDPATLDERNRERETRPRERRPLSEIVFGLRWGEPAPFVRARDARKPGHAAGQADAAGPAHAAGGRRGSVEAARRDDRPR